MTSCGTLASPVPRRQAFGRHPGGIGWRRNGLGFRARNRPGGGPSVRRASPRAVPSAARMAGLVATARRASAATRAITARGRSARRQPSESHLRTTGVSTKIGPASESIIASLVPGSSRRGRRPGLRRLSIHERARGARAHRPWPRLPDVARWAQLVHSRRREANAPHKSSHSEHRLPGRGRDTAGERDLIARHLAWCAGRWKPASSPWCACLPGPSGRSSRSTNSSSISASPS